MGSAKIELKGMDELMRRIEEMGKAGARIENEALKSAGEMLVEEMKKEVPVGDTKALKESIKASGVKSKQGVKRIEVGPKKFYGLFHEMGTSKMPANPFMSRSFNANKQRLKAIMKEKIRKGLGI